MLFTVNFLFSLFGYNVTVSEFTNHDAGIIGIRGWSFYFLNLLVNFSIGKWKKFTLSSTPFYIVHSTDIYGKLYSI